MNTYDEVALFFCDRDGHLRVEWRSLVPTDNLPAAALTRLILGPEAPEPLATIPEGTMLRGVTVQEGVARADFSAELMELMDEKHWGGFLGETITVYSIIH